MIDLGLDGQSVIVYVKEDDPSPHSLEVAIFIYSILQSEVICSKRGASRFCFKFLEDVCFGSFVKARIINLL